jgi:ribosomal protein S12 methylthiotransferase accessory factor YcaO
MDADFLAKVPDTVKALQGVKVDQTVKYGDVEIPLSIPYLPSDVEKNVVATATGDSLKYLSTRWFDEQGVSSPSKVANDIFLLENKDAIFQKIASEAATQALEHYVKTRGNINVSGEQQRTPELDKKGDVQKQLQENIWNI